MVSGMATTKVTITLPDEQVAQIKKLVQSGHAASVSGFVKHAVGVSLEDLTGWGAMLGSALEQTGGALTDEERSWADEILGTSQKKQRRKRRAA